MENKDKNNKFKFKNHCLYGNNLSLDKMEPSELIIKKYLSKRKNKNIK